MDFESFVDYLAQQGILQESDLNKIVQIYNEIDENDIRGFLLNNQSNQNDGEEEVSQGQQAVELQFIFALADFLKLTAQDNASGNGLFDIAQSIFESWKMQQEQKPVKFFLRVMEKEAFELERRMKDAFQTWRLKARIATLEERLFYANQSNNRDLQRSMDGEETVDVEWLTPMNQEGNQEEEKGSGRPRNSQSNSYYSRKTPVGIHAQKPPTQQNFKISDTVGVNININQFNTLSAGHNLEMGRKSKNLSRTPNSVSQKIQRHPKQAVNSKKKRAATKA